MCVQIAIVGAGPAGLLLGQLLHRAGIDAAIIELRSSDYVLTRIRAGVLEQNTVDLLAGAGVGDRVRAEGLRHHGIELAFDGRPHRIEFAAWTGHRCVTVYEQTGVTRDLMHARTAAGLTTIYEAQHVALHAFDGAAPYVTFEVQGQAHRIDYDFIVGCDGFHGTSRASVPRSAIKTVERSCPFVWLGVLSETPPISDELIYVNHERGFALCSMRSRMRSRYYLQCAAGENAATWTDAMFWGELRRRLHADTAARLATGPSIEKSMAPLRSFVAEPMRFGRLFLASDGAHIVPPTGAKGLNLAAADVGVLTRAPAEYCAGSFEGIDCYSERCLRRVWKAERFSGWLTSLLHRFAHADGFDSRVQRAELEYLPQSKAAIAALAENYVGLPLES